MRIMRFALFPHKGDWRVFRFFFITMLKRDAKCCMARPLHTNSMLMHRIG